MRVIPEISVVCPVQSHTMIDNITDITHTWGQPPLASDPFWDNSPVKVKDVGRINVPKQDNIVYKLLPQAVRNLPEQTDQMARRKATQCISLRFWWVCLPTQDLILDPGGGAKRSPLVCYRGVTTPIHWQAIQFLVSPWTLLNLCIALCIVIIIIMIIFIIIINIICM